MILPALMQKPKTKKTFNLRQKFTQIVTLGLICLFIFTPLAETSARVFEPGNIITDQELFDKDSLSQAAIQHFLERKNSVLARYSQIVNGQAKKASEIIWEISQLHGINPKFLLATLEKEQGLLHKSHATEKELDWATGYGCYGGQCNSKYKGFYDQVESSAITQKIYVEKASTFAFQVGKTTKTFDGYNLTPKNQATANLYIYTPYVGYSPELGVTKPYGGNRLFWRIWNRYFTKKYYPDGLVIKSNAGNYYLLEKNKKRKFKSAELFLADYKESDAILVPNDVLNAYENGPMIEFAKNTLVKSPTSGQIYLLPDYDTKRPLIENSALAILTDFRLAITENDVPTVTLNKLSNYQEGAPISSTSIYPQGKLFKDETGSIYLVQDGIKRLVDPVVWQKKYNSEVPETTTSASLKKYLSSTMDKLPDGTFVKNNGKYYLIAASGQRMKIETVEIIKRVFGSDKLITALSISDELLEVHTAGETIDYIDDSIKDQTTTTSSPTNSTTSAGTYQASFVSINPNSIIMLNGESKTVEVKFKNTGTATWRPENVYLKVFDRGTTESSFTLGQKFPLAESQVTNGGIGTFYPEITAPDTSGLKQVIFKLYYDKSGTATEIALGKIGKFISVKSGESAQILSHNIPIAVKNTWRPLDIIVRIKNTSKETTWTSKYTKLKVYDELGEKSKFYDPYDWLDEEVAALPINARKIKPGEVAEFKFTLKIKGLEPKVYTHKIVLELTDINKQVLLDGKSAWLRMMRVDQ